MLKVEFEEEQVTVTREVNYGLKTLKIKLSVVITTNLRLNESRVCESAEYHDDKEEVGEEDDAGLWGGSDAMDEDDKGYG